MAIDFSKYLKNIPVPVNTNPKVKLTGTRTSPTKSYSVALELELQPRDNGEKVLQLHGGVVGCESFYVSDYAVERMTKNGWCANAGGFGWDTLEISAQEMIHAFKELGLIQGE